RLWSSSSGDAALAGKRRRAIIRPRSRKGRGHQAELHARSQAGRSDRAAQAASGRLLPVVGGAALQNVLAVAISALDLAARAELQINARVAEWSLAAVACDLRRIDVNDFRWRRNAHAV